MELDKTFAVFSDINRPDSELVSERTDNLIHESGRMQLNTYQAFVQNLMNPRSDMRSLLLVHMTGTGKTITALATATEYVKQYKPNLELSSISSIIVLGFTKDIFKKELMSHPEFMFVNMDEAKHLKELELHMHDSPAIAEQYQIKRKQYQRRLIKREVKGIYQFYGYRQFVNRIINMDDVQQMLLKRQNDEPIDDADLDPKLIKKWIESGDVRINTNFIKSLSRSLFICDEVHNLYKQNTLNMYGLAIYIIFDYFFNTLPTNDMDYGSVRSLLLSATPLTSSAMEIIPIISLLTGETLNQSDVFQVVDGVDQLTTIGLSKIRKTISGKVSYIMDDNPKEYPSSSFVGEKIKNIEYVRFIRSSPIGHQLNCFEHWNQRGGLVDDRGSNMIKDITFPATKEFPYGVIFSRNINDLYSLPDNKSVYKSPDGFYTSNIFKLKELSNYSCKYAQLIKMCLAMKGTKDGKIFIYHPFVQGSGTDLLVSLFNANGFVLDGNQLNNDSICMHCNKLYGNHSGDHDFTPVQFTYITGSLNKSVVASRLNAFNNDLNTTGERIKIIIGSKAMRESHTLKACRHVMIVHEPSSISEMIQIIGRAVRKHVHAMLPADQQTVQIYVLSTNIENIKHANEDVAANEELSYKMKVLQYIQIDRIERIMYDVSIDYLINFRFKLRETPPLLGESYPLDTKQYNDYEKILTKTYAELRNGTTSHGIHTNRFNIFYFEGEVRLVIMIIKRILLDHQPVISIAQLRLLVRAPPFYVEYNTNLISDESIIVAINRLIFKPEQMRIIMPVNKITTVDSLFDQSSILIDTNDQEYKIVCIGDPLCTSSYLVKKTVLSIIEGDQSIIDSYRRIYSTPINAPIDLKELSVSWAKTIDVNDILDDIKSEWKNNQDEQQSINELLQQLPLKTHALLAELAIKYASDIAFKKIKGNKTETNIYKFLIDFYRSKRLIFIISELKHTRIYDRYKKFDVNTGSSWFSTNARPSTATLPIGHTIIESVRIYNPVESTWLELNSLGTGIQEKHPFGFYIYEEQIEKKLDVAIKIKFEGDPKAKGITMVFLQVPDIIRVAKQLKVDISNIKVKSDMIAKIEIAAWKIQEKLYPKRVIYRLIDI